MDKLIRILLKIGGYMIIAILMVISIIASMSSVLSISGR